MDGRVFMAPEGAGGIGHGANEETFAFAVQPMVDSSAPKTWRRRNAAHSGKPAAVDQDFAAGNLQAKVYRAIYGEGAQRAPPDS
eukprot:1886497-Pyramimonas_sp.AAC.1